jgi:GT2 family glycosyltransferase
VTALRAVGEIDERYFIYMEDIEHSLRMRAAGYQLGYAAASRAWHKGGATVGHHSPRHDYYMVRNVLIMSAQYFRRTLPAIFAYTIYRAVLPKIFRRQRQRLTAVLRAFHDYRRGVTGRVTI